MTRYPALLLVLAAACAPESSDDASVPPAPAVLTFAMQSREMTYEDCIAGSQGCTYIRVDYPAIVEAPPGAAIEAVTSVIDSFLLAPVRPDDEPASSVNALMAKFLSDYAAFKASDPRSEIPWFLERKAFALRSTPNFLGLSLSERSFLGGAHGLATLRFVNLDPSTGARLELTDVLKEGALPEVTREGEARFREVRAIAEDVTLEEAGFTFENGVFALPSNFTLRDDGLVFYYNPYEVAPYALGTTEIVLRWDEISDAISPEFALQSPASTQPPRSP
jgi:hypothetical protein